MPSQDDAVYFITDIEFEIWTDSDIDDDADGNR